MSTIRTKRLLFFLLLNFSILATSLIYNLHFERDLIHSCFFLNAFGFYCPGCGGSRSLNYLLHFNLIKSFICYPPLIITSIILLYVDFRLIKSIVDKDDNINGISYRIFLFIPNSIILNFLIKNLLLFLGIDLLGNVL